MSRRLDDPTEEQVPRIPQQTPSSGALVIDLQRLSSAGAVFVLKLREILRIPPELHGVLLPLFGATDESTFKRVAQSIVPSTHASLFAWLKDLAYKAKGVSMKVTFAPSRLSEGERFVLSKDDSITRLTPFEFFKELKALS